ncbi:HAMP domain-containing histidine kinase [Mycoplasmatota bacterium]|nr:HAMP domain-containing histidine kinase [Mycoplasmatota bacterium]
MRRILSKILISLFIVTIFTFAIPRLVVALFFNDALEDIPLGEMFLFGALIIGSLYIIFANIVLNYIIVRRIKHLNRATKRISQGDFDIHLEEFGKDEISQLTHNFNVMSHALNDNKIVNQSFMKDYAHEYKTPISIIKGYAELIEQTKQLEEAKEYASIIVKQSDTLSHLSQNILELSLLENNQIVSRHDYFNLSEEIRLIIQSMQPKWEEKNISLDLLLDDIFLTTNKQFVYIMLRNLIDNSIKYAYQNSLISIKVYQDECIHLDIQNHSETIEAHELSKIFDLFYRSDKHRVVYGHGVGLSLVKKIINKLDYQIDVMSQNNITTFLIQIPISIKEI